MERRRVLPMCTFVALVSGLTIVNASGSGDSAAGPVPASPPPISCLINANRSEPITLVPGRRVLCAIDVGSKNIKLVVVSMEPGKPSSIRDERQCRRSLGLGAKVFDQETQTAKDLPETNLLDLIETTREFQNICRLDKGTLVGADATQWARDALNIGEVRRRLREATGLDLDVLTPEREGTYAYVAATFNNGGRLALDPGSNSFQLSWRERGSAATRSVSIPFGYVRAAGAYMAAANDYAAAQKAYRENLKKRIDQAFDQLTPPTGLESIRAAVARGDLSGDIVVLGQDGAIHLAVRGELRDGSGKWLDDRAAYEARLAGQAPTAYPEWGLVTTRLRPAEIKNYLSSMIGPADFAALKSERVSPIYGEKALTIPVLLDFLVDELGLASVVLVPQETPTGYVLAKLQE